MEPTHKVFWIMLTLQQKNCARVFIGWEGKVGSGRSVLTCSRVIGPGKAVVLVFTTIKKVTNRWESTCKELLKV